MHIVLQGLISEGVEDVDQFLERVDYGVGPVFYFFRVLHVVFRYFRKDLLVHQHNYVGLLPFLDPVFLFLFLVVGHETLAEIGLESLLEIVLNEANGFFKSGL